jgi:choline-sulfatase
VKRRDVLRELCAVGLGSRFHALAAPPPRPRNILLFLCDEFRFDGAHYSGNPFPLTPALDELARTGVNFARTYSQNPVCTPARTSLLLGRYSHSTGVWGNNQLSNRNQPSFTQMLRANGYKAACFGKLHVGGRDDLDWDVQKIDDYPFGGQTAGPPQGGKQGRKKDGGKNGKGGGPGQPGGHPAPFPDDQHPEVKVARDTVEFMAANRERPWFIQCSLFRPHTPWQPPQKFWDRIDASKIVIPRYPDDDLNDVNPNIRMTERIEAIKRDDDVVRNAIHGYYACIAFVDDLIGQVLASLDKLGQRNDTLILFTADHGEMLYDHFLWGKSCFFEGSVHIPLLMNWRGRLPEGKTSRALVEHIDVFPTLMDLTGVKIPESAQGRSLAPILRGNANKVRDVVHSEDRTGMTMRFDGRYKFILNPAGIQPELYDLQSDPREITNLAGRPEQQDRVAKLTADINMWSKRDAVPRQPGGQG